MHFHLPKPLHGWREFAGEIAIIVIGVLIALGAEQMVEEWHWRGQVAAGRDALRDDFVNIVVNARERQGEDACIRRRLGDLVALLNRGHGAVPAMGSLGSPPERTWYPASWDSLVASDVTAHMPRGEMLNFSGIAQSARMAQDTSQQELYDWATIYTLVGPARQLDSGEAAQIRRAIASAMYRLNLLRLVAPQIERAVLQTGILTRADRDAIRQDVERTQGGPNWRAICGPVQAPSGRAVEAPYDPAIQINPLYRSESPAHSPAPAQD